MTTEKHCETCICGRRALVQRCSRLGKGPGTIAWEEHLRAWSAYDELVEYLGDAPKTWEPSR